MIMNPDLDTLGNRRAVGIQHAMRNFDAFRLSCASRSQLNQRDLVGPWRGAQIVRRGRKQCKSLNRDGRPWKNTCDTRGSLTSIVNTELWT